MFLLIFMKIIQVVFAQSCTHTYGQRKSNHSKMSSTETIMINRRMMKYIEKCREIRLEHEAPSTKDQYSPTTRHTVIGDSVSPLNSHSSGSGWWLVNSGPSLTARSSFCE